MSHDIFNLQQLSTQKGDLSTNSVLKTGVSPSLDTLETAAICKTGLSPYIENGLQGNPCRKILLSSAEPTGELLDDVSSGGRQRPWKDRKIESLMIGLGFALLGDDGAFHQILHCGSWLRFEECSTLQSGHTKKLVGAQFCRHRFCSLCAWRKSLLASFQVREVCHTALQRHPGIHFLLLTLTVPNVSACDLSLSVDSLLKSWKLLREVSSFRKAVLGSFRSVEVTYNSSRDDYHPHIHALLCVPGSYFKSRFYISRECWLEIWRKATRNLRITQVDIRKVRSNGKCGDSGLAGAASEVAKYCVKGAQLTRAGGGFRSLDDVAANLAVLSPALKKRQLYSYSGLLREVYSELGCEDVEQSDLIKVGDYDSCSCSVCGSDLVYHIFNWTMTCADYVG